MTRIPLNVQNPVTKIWEPPIQEWHVANDVDELLALNKAECFAVRERIPYCHQCHRKIGRKSQGGIPDRIGYFPPKSITYLGTPNYKPVHFYIELKRPGGKHRIMQDLMMKKARADGVVAFFCESRDQMVANFLEAGIILKVS